MQRVVPYLLLLHKDNSPLLSHSKTTDFQPIISDVGPREQNSQFMVHPSGFLKQVVRVAFHIGRQEET